MANFKSSEEVQKIALTDVGQRAADAAAKLQSLLGGWGSLELLHGTLVQFNFDVNKSAALLNELRKLPQPVPVQQAPRNPPKRGGARNRRPRSTPPYQHEHWHRDSNRGQPLQPQRPQHPWHSHTQPPQSQPSQPQHPSHPQLPHTQSQQPQHPHPQPSQPQIPQHQLVQPQLPLQPDQEPQYPWSSQPVQPHHPQVPLTQPPHLHQPAFHFSHPPPPLIQTPQPNHLFLDQVHSQVHPLQPNTMQPQTNTEPAVQQPPVSDTLPPLMLGWGYGPQV